MERKKKLRIIQLSLLFLGLCIILFTYSENKNTVQKEWLLVDATDQILGRLASIVAKIIRAPFFFLAVGSKANVGGAASAPVVASAFHPSLAPVGVLLAVLGYALGTYGAIICATLMQSISP